MFCTKCGTEINDRNFLFCTKCGTKIPWPEEETPAKENKTEGNDDAETEKLAEESKNSAIETENVVTDGSSASMAKEMELSKNGEKVLPLETDESILEDEYEKTVAAFPEEKLSKSEQSEYEKTEAVAPAPQKSKLSQKNK